MTNQFSEIVASLVIPGEGGGYVQRRDPRISVLSVYAAKRIDTGLESLLVKVDPELIENQDDWPQSEGFRVWVRPDPGSGDSEVLLCLDLVTAEFRGLFLALAEDLCAILASKGDQREAVQALKERLYCWQAFLKRHRPEGLSEDQQVGLFGELHVLRSLFLGALDPMIAIAGWRGCKKANQDFQYPGLAVEVKCTRAATPSVVHVSNVMQLDDEGIGSLYLSVVAVSQNQSAGETLAQLVQAIRGVLAGDALRMFNSGLMEVGYLDAHQSLYERDLYQASERLDFSVVDGFPRLTREQLPDGVKSVSYQISLDACRPYVVDGALLSALVENLANRLKDD